MPRTDLPQHDLEIALRPLRAIAEVEAEAWDALGDPERLPFLSWRFLDALERTGCVGPERGWLPCHLTAWHEQTLIAAAPAYVKGDGMGDFSRDWSLYELLQARGGALYPKLVVGVPFTPVPGHRILVHPELDRRAGIAAITQLARVLVDRNELGCAQILYHHPDERDHLAAGGFTERVLVQYHWHNRDYRTIDDWLADLPSKRRTQIRRERREPERQGITIRTLRAAELDARPQAYADLAFELYQTTCEKYMWGGTYLNRELFHFLFREMTHSVELVLAERGGEPIAGAINVATPTHLYGRYWGCFEEHRFLHFNVCLYHSVEQCIERGISAFEGGAGGEHKLARGFRPTPVYSSLRFREATVDRTVAVALRYDAQLRQREIDAWHRERGPDGAR